MQQMATEQPAGEELSLAERAYRAIRDRLVMLEIHPGAPINEDQLAQSLGVGRTPVREALKRLQYERLITTFPGAAPSPPRSTSPTWPTSPRCARNSNPWPPPRPLGAPRPRTARP